MSYQLRFTDEAIEDFDRLYDYLITYAIDLADRAYDAIMKAITMLGRFPSHAGRQPWAFRFFGNCSCRWARPVVWFCFEPTEVTRSRSPPSVAA
jgi:hypothetical protein